MIRLPLLLFVACVAGILYLSFYPWHFLDVPNATGLVWSEPSSERRAILDAVLNVGFYVPLGVTAILALRRKRSAWALALSAGVMLSLGIEWTQRYVPGRCATYLDWLTNSVGTAIGVFIATAAGSARLRNWPVARWSGWRIAAAPAALLAFWCLSRTFPFVPTLSLERLGDAVTRLTTFVVSPADLGLGFIALFVLSAAVDGWIWLLCALVVIPAEALIVQHDFSPSLAIGAALGGLVGRIVGRREPRWIGAAVFFVWLAADELRPFHFGPAQPFYWVPFEGLMTGAPDTYGAVVLTKLFVYGSAIWLARAARWPWPVTLALPTVLLTAGEWAQRFLAGRTPESTDLVLLFVAAATIKGTEHAVARLGSRTSDAVPSRP